MYPHLNFEKKVWSQGKLCCGVDEVGKGCVAGPVVAAAVVFGIGHKPYEKIRDSKMLTPVARFKISEHILENCLDFGVGLVSAGEIDKIGITAATQKAMIKALEMIDVECQQILIDGREIDGIENQVAIIKGDLHVYSIAAASIIAKVFRDAIVSGLDNVYCGYDFKSHKGYGTKKHFEFIKKLGLTSEHRKTFLKNYIVF